MDALVFSPQDSKESLAEKGRGLVTLYVWVSDERLREAVEEPFEIPLVDVDTDEDLGLTLRGVLDRGCSGG